MNYRQIGENGHKEYTWSDIIQEQILQFHSQITRTKTEVIEQLGTRLNNMLLTITTDYKISNEQRVEMLSVLYRMIGQTRDIIDGKGEYALSYMMIYIWYNYYPELAKYALRLFVTMENEHEHPYGSWKDIKYFCDYCKNQNQNTTHPLIDYAIDVVNEQLRKDISSENPSLAAKWIPREKSKRVGWLFEKMATHYFYSYMQTASADNTKRKTAKLKCFTEYRKICSELNKKLDTVQVKQCSNNWSSIDPIKQTSITMHKQKNAFLNKTKKGEQRTDLEDRIQCSQHFQDFIANAVKGEVSIKGKRIGLNDFTKDALELIQNKNNQSESINLLNAQWKNNASQTNALGKMIAMVDTSGSMNGDPLYAAIALGIRVAEKSILGKRVMTFSANPTWVNLDVCENFVEMVECVSNANWGMNTNIYAALDMILDAIVGQKLTADESSNMVLAIFSDMQIDEATNVEKGLSLYESIEKKYSNTGIRICGRPYRPPHILFWNLRSTNGFPTLSVQPNVSCMSGFSPSLLNLFSDFGLDALKNCTPWSLLLKTLENERYFFLDKKLKVTLDVLL
jgi:hypothetical protein